MKVEKQQQKDGYNYIENYEKLKRSKRWKEEQKNWNRTDEGR